MIGVGFFDGDGVFIIDENLDDGYTGDGVFFIDENLDDGYTGDGVVKGVDN